MLYLEIEKIRFGSRLQYSFKINENCRNFPLPTMILQPIFENAIKHGVYESTGEVTISFSCQPYRNGLMIKISNNFDPDTPPRPGNRMGLKNISNRLKLIYQYEDLIRIHKHNDVFELELMVPDAPAIA
jgi:LytS/YehU family sensor histidine kinase